MLLYSGWYCVPTNQGWSGISTTSTSPVSEGSHQTFHSVALEILQVFAVEFVAVAMTLLNLSRTVSLRSFRSGTSEQG